MNAGPDPDPHSDLSIVLLGHTGTGKSASGNTILGREAFVSKASFKAVTTEICERSGKRFGKLIQVIDTPGILQNQDTEDEIQTRCQCVLESSRPCLFLVVVSVTRFTGEQEQAVRRAIQVLGDDGMKKSFILFTSGDALKTSVDNFIFEDDDGSLPEIVQRFGRKFHLFNNEDGGKEQVRELLIKSHHLQTSGHESDPAGTSSGVFRQEEIRIVLTGLPESGKSSSGNTILGSNRFKSERRFQAANIECVCGSATVDGRQVTVVDSPGFTEELQTPQQLYHEITRIIAEARPGPHVFVIVVKIGRISKADSVLLKMLLKLMGCGAQHYSVVLFTHGDELKDQSISEMIQSDLCVSELVSVCGHRFCVFDNRGRETRRQVHSFLSKVDNMVAANRGQLCTSDMFRIEAPPTGFWTRVCRMCCSCQWGRSSSASDDDQQVLLQMDQASRTSYETFTSI